MSLQFNLLCIAIAIPLVFVYMWDRDFWNSWLPKVFKYVWKSLIILSTIATLLA